MLDVLERDLTDFRGRPLVRSGEPITVDSVRLVADRARLQAPFKLAATAVAKDVHAPLVEVPYRRLFRRRTVQEAVTGALLGAELPLGMLEEIQRFREQDRVRYRHGIATAVVAVRMLLASIGETRALPSLAAAAFLHDVGMCHMPPDLCSSGRALDPAEARQVATHPLRGAIYLASQLGPHPAVEAALGHHWRGGRGYPHLPEAPSQLVEGLAVASRFVAMTQPRPFRSAPFDARGAVDILIAEAHEGEADPESVQLLVYALRGAEGDLWHVQYGKQRPGAVPDDNVHTSVARAIASK